MTEDFAGRIPLPMAKSRNPPKFAAKKLRESEYFLGLMKTAARPRSLDSEELGFLLSAFLSSSKSMTESLGKADSAWVTAWRSGRTQEEKDLLEFLRNQRDYAVHVLNQRGLKITATTEFAPVTTGRIGNSGRRESRVRWWGPPGARPPMAGAKIHVSWPHFGD